MSDAWKTNCTLDEVAAWVRRCSKICVLTHLKPDGDAVGSALGACRAIRQATSVRADCWFAGPMPTFFEEVASEDEWRVLGTSDIPAREYDGVLIVDTGSWNQLEPMHGFLEGRGKECTVLDHHRQGDADVAARLYVDVDAAAASIIVGELATKLFGGVRVSELPKPVAEALLVGLASDTGWFRHSNTDARALWFASQLVAAGVEYSRLYEIVQQRDRPGRLRLMGRALCSMELLKGDSVALMTVKIADFEAAGATQGDSGGFSDLPLAIKGVAVGVVITEGADRDGPIAKVSMRSKDGPGAVDVNVVAGKLGGGGHARAAGARMRCSMEEGRRRVLEALG
jgi:phosphoesterase RecJ-like protein